MERFITYKEKDLDSAIDRMKHYISWIEDYTNLMKEQHEGRRSNIDMGISLDILNNIEKLKDVVSEFETNEKC